MAAVTFALLRPLGLALLLLCAPAWSDNRASTSGSSGSSGPGGGMTRPMGLPSTVSTPWPGNRTTPGNASSSGSGKDATRMDDAARDAARDAAKEAAKEAAKDAAKDNLPGRSGRDDPGRREGDERGGATPARPGGDGPDGRWQRGERLVRSQPLVYERDPIGAPVLRAEITLLLPPDAELPAGLARRGFIAVREAVVLGRRLVVLRTPADLTLPMAVDLGRRLAPEAEIDFNHVLLGSGRPAPSAPARGPAGLPVASTPAPPAAADAVHVGLIDEALPPGGEPALPAEVRPVGRRCAPPARPEGHGMAVATVLARSVRDAGRRPVLHAADIGCGQGAVDAIAAALQAMDAERVPVVNVSAVGPYNRVMAAVVAAFLARGHLLVAAVGNDGPAAPPLYPAAYPGVVGVTAVDRQGRVLVEAGRGEHVAFAAPGVVELPAPDGSPRSWRGTSLAAPVVAAALALRLPAPDVAAAPRAVEQLARLATDAGEPGRDRVYGHGVVGLAPTALAAAH